jgi:hypothetical protein
VTLNRPEGDGLSTSQHADRERHVVDRSVHAGNGRDLATEGEVEVVALGQGVAVEALGAGHEDRRREQPLRRDVRANPRFEQPAAHGDEQGGQDQGEKRGDERGEPVPDHMSGQPERHHGDPSPTALPEPTR